MFHPYSLDLRERAVALLDEGATSVEVAELLDVSDSWVRKMRLRREALGHLIPGSPPGKERLLSEAQEEQLCLLVFEQPDATLEELVVLMAKRMKVRASISTVSRRLIEMGMSRKKRVSTQAKLTVPRSNESASASSAGGSSEAPHGCSSSTKQASISR
jgi:putative transposase